MTLLFSDCQTLPNHTRFFDMVFQHLDPRGTFEIRALVTLRVTTKAWNLKAAILTTNMFLGGGRKLEDLEKPHTDTKGYRGLNLLASCCATMMHYHNYFSPY